MNHIRFTFLSITVTIALFGTETPGPVAQQQCSHIVRRLSSYKTEEHIDEIIKSVQSVAQEKQIDEALLFKSLCRKLKAVQYQYEIKMGLAQQIFKI